MSASRLTRAERRERFHKLCYNNRIEHIIDYCRGAPTLTMDSYGEVDVIEGDFNIKPHLHFVLFSCGFFEYSELKKTFPLYPIASEDRYDCRKDKYKDFYLTSIPNQNWKSPLDVWTVPYNKNRPGIMLGISLPDGIYNAISILRYLANRIPKLKTSYIEYAIDYMVDTPDKAIKLHQVFEQYVKAKWIRKDPSKAEYYFKYGQLVRFYCRGKDRDKQKGEIKWPEEKLDRVRCEFLLPRSNKMTNKLKIRTIEDLIENTRFTKVISNRIQFKQAKLSSKYFPKIWETDYASFQKTLKSYRDKYGSSRIDKDVEEIKSFNHLMQATEIEISRYEKQWEIMKERCR